MSELLVNMPVKGWEPIRRDIRDITDEDLKMVEKAFNKPSGWAKNLEKHYGYKTYILENGNICVDGSNVTCLSSTWEINPETGEFIYDE